MQQDPWSQFSSGWGSTGATGGEQPQYMVSGGATYAPPMYNGWGAAAPQQAWGNEEQEESEEEEEEEIEDEDVKCAFCGEFLNEPRVLSCMHNFCTACLQRQASQSRFPVVINCPTCGHVEKLDARNGVLGLQRNYQMDEIVEERKLHNSDGLNSQEGYVPAAPISSIFPKATEEAEVFTINNEISSYPTDHVFLSASSIKAVEEEIPQPIVTEKEPDDFTKFLLNEASNRSGAPAYGPYSTPPPIFGPPPVTTPSALPVLPTAPTPTQPSLPLYPSFVPEKPSQPQQSLYPELTAPYMPNPSQLLPDQENDYPTLATVPVYATYASAPTMPPQVPQRPAHYVPSVQPQQPQQPQQQVVQQPQPPQHYMPQQPSALVLPPQQNPDQMDLCHPSLLDHKRINFAPYSKKPEALDAAIDHWVKSLWFTPAGFFTDMKKESIKLLYTPFWYFNVEVTTQYQGQVCKLTDDKGRKAETWHLASGDRKGSYPGRLMYAGPDATLKHLIASFKKHWNLKLIKFAPATEEEKKKKEEEDYKNSSWAGKLFKAIASVAVSAPPPHNPPAVELLMPFCKWELIWKEFERELVKNEEAEAAGKLSRELLATKVKDVKINMTVQVNKWLVYMPTAIVTYSYDNAIYKVVANGQTGEVVGERPAYGTGKLGEMGKAGLDMIGGLLWSKKA